MVYIPGFLVKKVYEHDSLTNTDYGFEFCFSNRMTPLRISGMRGIKIVVDGTEYHNDNLELTLAGETIDMSGGKLDKPVSFSKDMKLVVAVKGDNLPDGKHVMKISFITNEYGGASLKVTDYIGKRPSSLSLWTRLKSFVTGSSGEARAGPISVDGELGGVPLDPDFSRLEAALRREEPDRVPFFEAEIALPIQEWFLGREIGSAEDEVEFYIRAGYDFVPVVPPFFTPRLMRTASSDGHELNESDSERTWLVESEGLIKTIKDVEEFPWPKVDEIDFSSFEEIGALLPPKMKMLGLLSPAAVFGNVSQAMGLENFCYALSENIAVIEAMFEIVGSSYVQIAKKLANVPRVGAVFMSDDLAFTQTTFVSPEIYRKYVFPWYKQIGEILSNAGLPFIFHSDGTLISVLDDLADCGICAIHPIEPLAMDIVEVKKRFGDRFCIFGNIDLEYTLTRGSVEEVEELVKKKIRELGPGGGWGLSASNSVPDYVKRENFKAMITAGKKYGKYPISV